MKKMVVLSLLLIGELVAISARAGTKTDYTLAVGDVISIDVFNESNLTIKAARLTATGTLAYPFLGDIPVQGKTIKQVQNYITSGLKGDYLINPIVTVRLIEYRKYFVRGEVKSPGGFSYAPQLTLQKAIALAGGFTERASRKKIQVTREKEGEQQTLWLTLGDEVLPGDIINIKESFF
ncbi:polysaccharide biosynthesis/export family protein [Candidatus Sororendozoicomonas aggregata]|uniref:polysaccharide biosynthesis/export family protein n=1 Tax=Candidatus Sororendozoicomonas aggregata TaxID=3073239 RepID=UPI002ED3E2BE